MDIQRKNIRRKRNLRILALSLLLITVAMISYAVIFQFNIKSGNVRMDDIRVAEARLDTFEEFLPLVAERDTGKSFPVRMPETGVIRKILVEHGAYVNAGDPLFVIELKAYKDDARVSYEIDLEMIRSYEEKLAKYTKKLVIRGMMVDQMEVEVGQLRKEIVKLKKESEKGHICHDEIDKMEQSYSELKKLYWKEKKSFAVDSVKMSEKISNLECALDDLYKKESDLLTRSKLITIKARHSGVISLNDDFIGSYVEEGFVIARIWGKERLKLKAKSNKNIAPVVNNDMKARLLMEDTFIWLAIDSISDEQQQQYLFFTIDDSAAIKLPDLKKYQIQVITDLPHEAIVIDRGSFIDETGGHWIYVISEDGKTALKREVEIINENVYLFEVKDGLKPGEKVIISSYKPFREKKKLRIK